MYFCVPREECQWLFNELYRHNIPLLIFSAGLGDIIREIISCQASEIYENMKIVANFLSYNEDVSRLIWFFELQ